MRNIIVIAALAIAGCTHSPHVQDEAAASSEIPAGMAKPADVEPTAPPTEGLADLETMTFDCPKAGLNAAAREAAKVPSQGTYQFSYFKIIHDAHHSSYEVHFKSNHVEEPDLRYCVSMYCQQGWDPRKTRTVVRLMSDEASGAKAQVACGTHGGEKKKQGR